MEQKESRHGFYAFDDDLLITTHLLYQLELLFENTEIILDVFNNPIKGLEKIKQNEADGIRTIGCLMDFQMPELRGDLVIRELKSFAPWSKVIMVSGNTSDKLVADLADEGLLSFYIEKPWEDRELKEKINEILPPELKYT